MTIRAEDQLQSLDNLLTQSPLRKACTLGTIIDSTSAYFDYKEKKYVKKIKIIDQSMNTSNLTANFRYGYCTVMFFDEKVQNLPNPFSVGDILYLRRFAFQIYDQSFQARNNSPVYCSWALLRGDAQNNQFAEYQVSKSTLNLNDAKYFTMKEKIQELRDFSRLFLQKNTVLMTVPAGVTPKDQDYVVQIVRKNQQGTLRVRDGKRELIIKDCPTYVQQHQIAKLRSVAKVIVNADGQHEVVTNNFTSLLKLPEWTSDAQNFLQKESVIEMEEETNDIFTDLGYLNSAALSQIEGKKFYVRCEVFNISARTFEEAVKYYNPLNNTVYDKKNEETIPVYKFMMSCQDVSTRNIKNGALTDIWLFSYDGQGADFVEKVNLAVLDELSSFKQENLLFERKVNLLLESQQVKLTVQVLSDGKGNRAFRALTVKL